MHNHTEMIRQKYCPERVRILFVGESPPAAGTFFYTCDSLTTYTQQAFQRVYPEVGRMSPAQFLNYFQQKGCYLDDLCLEPVNHMHDEQRENARRAGVQPLSARIRSCEPDHIIAIHKGSSDMVKLARSIAGSDAPVHVTPFPSHGNQWRYVDHLERILQEIEWPTNCVAHPAAQIEDRPPEDADFERELLNMFETSTDSYVDVVAGELHKWVGGYPSRNHRMPVCCNVMRRYMTSRDSIMYEPPQGSGATFHVRYRLPR